MIWPGKPPRISTNREVLEAELNELVPLQFYSKPDPSWTFKRKTRFKQHFASSFPEKVCAEIRSIYGVDIIVSNIQVDYYRIVGNAEHYLFSADIEIYDRPPCPNAYK